MSEDKTPTVVGLLNKVASDFCDNYCRWPWVYRDPDREEDEGRMYEEKCNECPLNILGL